MIACHQHPVMGCPVQRCPTGLRTFFRIVVPLYLPFRTVKGDVGGCDRIPCNQQLLFTGTHQQRNVAKRMAGRIE